MHKSDFDIAIIGGGFSGLGLAAAAVHHGFSVALFERRALCSETSANSLRIVHGGFRYLQTLNLPRVRESIAAQSRLLAEFPELVQPLRCLMPLKPFGHRSRIPVSIALNLYSRMISQTHCRAGRVLTASEMREELPQYAERFRHGALEWWDAQLLDPHALALKLQEHAQQLGARFFVPQTIAGIARLRDRVELSTSDGAVVTARVACNACGPSLNSFTAKGVKRSPVSWSLGFNLVFRQKVDNCAITGEANGRLLFLVPRILNGEQIVAVGTWYIPAPNAESTPGAEDIAKALRDLAIAFPELSLRHEDLVAVEASRLPLKRFKGDRAILYGREEIWRYGRYFEILSTKFTTFQEQAERTLRVAAPLLR